MAFLYFYNYQKLKYKKVLTPEKDKTHQTKTAPNSIAEIVLPLILSAISAALRLNIDRYMQTMSIANIKIYLL